MSKCLCCGDVCTWHISTFLDDGRFLAIHPGPWTSVGLKFPNNRRQPSKWRTKVKFFLHFQPPQCYIQWVYIALLHSPYLCIKLRSCFFYYVFHIQCQKYLFTDLNLLYRNNKTFSTSNVKKKSHFQSYFCHWMWKT